MLRLLASFLVLGLLAIVGLGAWGWHSFTAPGPLDQPRNVLIESGSGVRDIAAELEEGGIISNGDVFLIATRLKNAAARLRAGEYAFQPSITMSGVLDKLASGDVVVRRVTVAEGLTTRSALALVEAAEGLTGEVPEDVPEGALLPDTYHYHWGDSRAVLVDRMRGAMEEAVATLWEQRDPGSVIETPGELVTLASIVERETAVPDERPTIAGVFINRLERGMRLQSDPTVIYAQTQGQGGFDGPIRRSDLDADLPYNTYVIDGLPPGPIANPGTASLEAVIRPAETDALYFVADGTGGHVFSKTLSEHQENVRRWRQLERERRQNEAN